MSSQMPDFDNFEFEPEEERGPGDEMAFPEASDRSSPASHKEANEDTKRRASSSSQNLADQAAQVAFQTAQGASTTFQQPLESARATWSAALAEEVTLMETLAASASRASNLTEALALVAALPVVALRLTPHSYRALWPLLPTLIQGVQGVTQFLYGRSNTRPLITLLPAILEGSIGQLADQVALDRPLTPMNAAKSLAFHTGQMLQKQERRATVVPESGIRQRNGHGYRS
jgi:hypothetical protein